MYNEFQGNWNYTIMVLILNKYQIYYIVELEFLKTNIYFCYEQNLCPIFSRSSHDLLDPAQLVVGFLLGHLASDQKRPKTRLFLGLETDGFGWANALWRKNSPLNTLWSMKRPLVL